MKVTELNGATANENCLHCHLIPVIQEFVNKHPDYERGVQVIMDLAQNLGELIGSGIYNSGRRHQLDHILAIAAAETRKTATEIIQTLDRTRTS